MHQCHIVFLLVWITAAWFTTYTQYEWDETLNRIVSFRVINVLCVQFPGPITQDRLKPSKKRGEETTAASQYTEQNILIVNPSLLYKRNCAMVFIIRPRKIWKEMTLQDGCTADLCQEQRCISESRNLSLLELPVAQVTLFRLWCQGSLIQVVKR